MDIYFDLSNNSPDPLATARSTAMQSRVSNEVNKDPEAEQVEESASPFAFQKELTPEEEQRVLFLKNLLSQILAMAQGNPTDEQKERIREIEAELEKITGVKMKTRLSAVTAKLPGKDKDEDEKRNEPWDIEGIDPEEAKHNRTTTKPQGDNPGMRMLMNNAFFMLLSLDPDSRSAIGPPTDGLSGIAG